MYITVLKFNEVLDWFYNQQDYKFMLLFVSSFDYKDKNIVKEIVDNARRIDRLTGKEICFFYFVEDRYEIGAANDATDKLMYRIMSMDIGSMYGAGVSVTMETADDICKHFDVRFSSLPAFILLDRQNAKDSSLFSVREYSDLELFLTPINIVHGYLEDKERILAKYEAERRKTVVTEWEVGQRNEQRNSWNNEINRLKRRKEVELSQGKPERTKKRDEEILALQQQLKDNPVLVENGIDETVSYPQDELDLILRKSGEKLNFALNIHNGSEILDQLKSSYDYNNLILEIWEQVSTKEIRLSRTLENIRREIYERGFDVFISCKSQDYQQAHELRDYLVKEGFKPFLADTSIKEVGIDQYTALIGEVINACQYMIVFVTDVEYLNTPYVFAEWNSFVNDINTGHKPNAKIINILAPNIDIHSLPIWLRDKQCYTIESYEGDLLYYLREEAKRFQECGRYINSELEETMCNECMVVSEEILDLDVASDSVVDVDGDGSIDSSELYTDDVEEFERPMLHTPAFGGFMVMPIADPDTSSINVTEPIVGRAGRGEESFNNDDKLSYIPHYGDSPHIRSYKDEVEYCINSIDKTKRLLEEQDIKFNKEISSIKEQVDRETAIIERLDSMKVGNTVGGAIGALPPISFLFGCVAALFTSHNKRDIENQKEEHLLNIKSLEKELTDIQDRKVQLFSDLQKQIEEHENRISEIKIAGSYSNVYSSIFAPAEIKRKSHLLVQVYLHLYEESDKVMSLAFESDKNTERRDYTPLQMKLKCGDKVDIEFNIYGETCLMDVRKSVIWQGSFTKCSFDYFVPNDVDMDELSCESNLYVNGALIGEMRFISKIVDVPQNRNSEILSRTFKKIFISYAHQDMQQVKHLALAYEAQGVDYFFDRDKLKPGDVYEERIFEYIDTSDLFILCWSKNAAQSNYVAKEKAHALLRAYPQFSRQNAKLKICPISIEPRAELPGDMKEIYHFKVI